MAAEQRKLLEALMGQQLMNSDGRASQLSITDPKVCRSYLVGTCPHDLFTNTKQDLGVCPKVHNEALKTEYEAADERQKIRWAFDFDYLNEMSTHLNSCNARINDARRKLEKTPEEIRRTVALIKGIKKLRKNIALGLLEVKALGELGSVNLAVTEHFKLRQARARKDEYERDLKAIEDSSGPSGHQKLQVCDVCGAYLSRLDNDRRLADHFFGKMHLGYAQMRTSYNELKERLRDREPPYRGGGRPGGRPNEGYGGYRGKHHDRGYGSEHSGGYGGGGRDGDGFGRRGGRDGGGGYRNSGHRGRW